MDRRRFLRYARGAVCAPAFARLLSRPEAAAAATRGRYSWDGILELPDGFSGKLLTEGMYRMDDGYRAPGAPDGMACFSADDGRWVLMRNHEVGYANWFGGPYRWGQSAPPEAYDELGMGGVTRLVLDPQDLEVERSHLALVGTVRNCAGGMSPWGWLSCEETTIDRHGYVFLCSSAAEQLAPAKRIAAYGRFNHEAAVVDPESCTAYLTEDRPDGCFYRFLPARRSEPFVGQLQALALTDGLQDGDTLAVGRDYGATWVDVDVTAGKRDALRQDATRRGALVVSRGEGLWLTEDAVVFSATTGGNAGRGQILQYTPPGVGQGVLKVLCEAQHGHGLDMPDNLTVDPWGGIWIVEDNSRANGLYLLRPDGSCIVFARNIRSASELAGVCFSPDGSTLFCNMQKDGLTLAIRGDFRSLSLGPGGP